MEPKKTMQWENRVATVNASAYGTWLYPYILCQFDVYKTSKKYLWFYMDKGGEKKEIQKFDIHVFDIE